MYVLPLIKSKGLRLQLSCKDSLVGNIQIDEDRDMQLQAALKAFLEEESLCMYGKTYIHMLSYKPQM